MNANSEWSIAHSSKLMARCFENQTSANHTSDIKN